MIKVTNLVLQSTMSMLNPKEQLICNTKVSSCLNAFKVASIRLGFVMTLIKDLNKMWMIFGYKWVELVLREEGLGFGTGFLRRKVISKGSMI